MNDRLLLVNTNTEKFPYPIPPLGLCLIASALEHAYEVKVFDGMFGDTPALLDVVRSFRPDYIGFGIRNIDDVVAGKEIFYPDQIADQFINPVRRITHVPLIIGGSGFSVFPQEMMELTQADYGISGEGEALLYRLLNTLRSGERPLPEPGLFIRGEGRDHRTCKLSGLPLSGMALADIDHHIDFSPYRQRGVYSIQTKRGCAFSCVYCNYPYLEGSRYRLREPAAIAREIAGAEERLGKVTFEFVDSTFNDPPGHAEAICQAIIDLGIQPRLRTMGVNPGNTSAKLIGLMKTAGFAQIDVTPDSASPRMIRNLRKGFTVEDIRRTARLLREFDLPAMWFFLFGGPGETPDTVAESHDFIRQHISDEDMVLMLAGMRIYPHTPLEKIALKEGVIPPGASLLKPSRYYFSRETPPDVLNSLIDGIRDSSFNCIPALESTPSQEMMQKALKIRQERGLTEPMFRTLLRIRKEMR